MMHGTEGRPKAWEYSDAEWCGCGQERSPSSESTMYRNRNWRTADQDLWSSPNSITLPDTTPDGEVSGKSANGIWAKEGVTGLPRTCRGRHGEVSIVEFGLQPGAVTDNSTVNALSPAATGRRAFTVDVHSCMLYMLQACALCISRDYDIMSKIRLGKSMRIHLMNNHCEFHSDLIWNDGALGFLKSVAPTRTTTTTRWVAIWGQFLIPKLFVYGMLQFGVFCGLW